MFLAKFAGARTITHRYRTVAVYSFASASASAHSKDFLSKQRSRIGNRVELIREWRSERAGNFAVCAIDYSHGLNRRYGVLNAPGDLRFVRSLFARLGIVGCKQDFRG